MATDEPQAVEPPPQPQPRPWWRRVPTPLIVTLLGAALSVLILPAITRQWDDRQKARELKAAVAQQIARATAETIGGSLALSETGGSNDGVANKWLVHRLNIEATLRTYFSEAILQEWKAYSSLTLTFVSLAGIIGEINTNEGATSVEFNRSVIKSLLESTGLSAAEQRNYLTYMGDTDSFQRDLGIDFLAEELVRSQEELAKNLLAAHPAGFSTSRMDLVRDLLP